MIVYFYDPYLVCHHFGSIVFFLEEPGWIMIFGVPYSFFLKFTNDSSYGLSIHIG